MSKNNNIDYDFVVRENEKGEREVFHYEEGLFGKKKLKKTDVKNLFSYSRNSLIKGPESYKIFPKVDGMNREGYLLSKAFFNLKNGISDFNFRTIWNFSDITEEEKDFKGCKVQELKCKVSICNEEGEELLANDNFIYPYISEEKLDSELIEILLQNAANGVFMTARDLDKMQTLNYNTNTEEKVPIWMCEECGEKFETVTEFFCHLIENKHYDSILSSHPYDPECKRVLQIINQEKEKEAV